MVSKICFLKNYYGGDCLHSRPLDRTGLQSSSNPNDKDLPRIDIPDQVSVDVPLVYYQRRLPEGQPSWTREPTAKEVAFFESTEPIKAIGDSTDYKVIDEKLTSKGETKLVNQSKYNQAAHAYNKVKGIPVKANAVLAAADVANFLYEHQDEIHTVEDFVGMYGEEIVEGAKQTASIVADAAMQGDIPTLAVTGVSLVGVPVVTRTIDNVADALGIEGVNTTGAVLDATQAASEIAQDVVKSSQNDNPFVVPTIGGLLSGLIKRWF